MMWKPHASTLKKQRRASSRSSSSKKSHPPEQIDVVTAEDQLFRAAFQLHHQASAKILARACHMARGDDHAAVDLPELLFIELLAQLADRRCAFIFSPPPQKTHYFFFLL